MILDLSKAKDSIIEFVNYCRGFNIRQIEFTMNAKTFYILLPLLSIGLFNVNSNNIRFNDSFRDFEIQVFPIKLMEVNT